MISATSGDIRVTVKEASVNYSLTVHSGKMAIYSFVVDRTEWKKVRDFPTNYMKYDLLQTCINEQVGVAASDDEEWFALRARQVDVCIRALDKTFQT